MKRAIILALIVLLIFIGTAFLGKLILEQFIPECYYSLDDEKFKENFNARFVSSEFAEAKDLGKYFLTVLIAVFVASITFSEKIVNIIAASWWAKSLLILCWILLLISIVLTGTGLVFYGACYNQALYAPCPENIDLYGKALYAMVMAGISFGFAMSSMLCAGITSFISTK